MLSKNFIILTNNLCLGISYERHFGSNLQQGNNLKPGKL